MSMEEINTNENIENIEAENVEVKAEIKEEEPQTNWVKELRDWVVAILIAVVVAFVVREFIFTLVKVDGASMEPSLQHNDRLYVNRMFYTPKKGDVIIFEPASDPGRPYVKRIIATEGDTIYIDFVAGKVYVNDEVIEEDYIKEKTKNPGTYVMNLMNTNSYSKDNPIVIQPGYVFVMGDNRNNSTDSRHLGPVPVEEIMGNAVFRFWPLDEFGSVHEDAE
ncbi:MAG: signal peptidase I [Clostridia bacterium]|nr:signal peptidase I [Clostridia bacterium]